MANTNIPLRMQYSGSAVTAVAEYQADETMALPGSLQLTGAGRRILADFSNSNASNRCCIQSSTVNGATVVQALPNGTSAISVFAAYSKSDPTNSPYATLYTDGNGVYVAADRLGTGAYLPLIFSAGGVEEARIAPDKNILFGTTNASGLWDASVANPGLQYDGPNKTLCLQSNTNSVNLFLSKRGLTNATFIGFNYIGTLVGSITTTGSAVAYNTTSDARVKTDITPLEDTRVYVAAMNPVLHKWNTEFYPEADNTLPTAGFLAQELEEIFPQAVTGKKDAVDEEGKIIPQGIDYSKLIPVLTSALKAEMTDNEQARQTIEELKEDNRVLKLQIEAVLARLNLEVNTTVSE